MLLRLIPRLKNLLENPETDNEDLDKFVALVSGLSPIVFL